VTAWSAVVLTGGASTRMGRDKALVPLAGVPMARRVADAAAAAGATEVLALGGDLDRLRAIGLDARPDERQGSGPLGGLVGALEVAAAPVVVVVACDLPWLTADAVAAVVAAQPGHDAALARTDRLEPLCGAWRRAAAATLRAAFDDGERAIHRAVRRLDVVTVVVDAAVLRNVNQPADLPDDGTVGR